MKRWILVMIMMTPSLSFSQVDQSKRVSTIQLALKAIADSTPQELEDTEQYIGTLRRSCRSQVPSVQMACTLETGKQYCQGRDPERCLPVVDILMVNKLNESLFLSTYERYRILKHSRGDPMPYRKPLMSRYANLVSQMILMPSPECNNPDPQYCLALKIETFCDQKRTDLGQNWQSCTSAMVWFIGRTQQGF